jgi:toluene monooxygenase system protein D
LSEPIKDLTKNNMVGPVLKTGEISEAVLEALPEDNPGKEIIIKDGVGLTRIQLEDECIIRRETMAAKLGRPFMMQELTVVLSSFAGQIDAESSYFRFYLNRKL